ncbi:hypothetical protein TNCT_264571 [Trichonephila clavata]|uniref:Uncharacterized protein n=1 Tax=Trichonephila clavata TaxID=2740835 RepID=A0A8X6KA41_TRICU|nr:hypothetical protein TNCT_264571 [Trichonephila clavata]
MREAAKAKAEVEKQAPAPAALIPRPVALQSLPTTSSQSTPTTSSQPKPIPSTQVRKQPNQPTAYNKTMTTAPPTTNFTDTIKEMQDPKVIEVFQVLRKIIQISKSNYSLADRAMQVAALLQIDGAS